jgi:hypothetical protein
MLVKLTPGKMKRNIRFDNERGNDVSPPILNKVFCIFIFDWKTLHRDQSILLPCPFYI